MAKRKQDAELAEHFAEVEAVPLAVVTREPSDDELVAELGALKVIAEKYAMRASEYHHAAQSLENAIWWIERARDRRMGKTA